MQVEDWEAITEQGALCSGGLMTVDQFGEMIRRCE